MPYARARTGRRLDLVVGKAVLETLRELAGQDGITLTEEIRRLVLLAHVTRTIARRSE